MRKLFTIVLTLSMLVPLCACGHESNTNPTDSSTSLTTNEVITDATEEAISSKKYIGNYEDEPVYQKIIEIENCTDPDQLCQMLNNLYGEEFYFIKLEYEEWSDSDGNHAGYKKPYDNFVCSVTCLYNSYRMKPYISSDTFAFFKENNEFPTFIMDSEGSYLVGSYEIKTFNSGEHAHDIVAWVCSDLFMCLHEFIDADEESVSILQEAVLYLDFYIEFENLIIDTLGDN